jgi:hypothetical protein
MSLVVATEAAKVRRMIGSPGTTELPAADLNAFFTDDALDWINSRRPSVAISSFTTVRNQQIYDVKPSNAIFVHRVWWLDASWLTFSPSMQVVPGALDIDDQLGGFSTFDNPALVQAFYKKITHYNDFFRGEGHETSAGVIQLTPRPLYAGDTVYFEYTFNRWSAVTAVVDEFVLGVRKYVASIAMQYLATKRGIVTGGRDWSGGAGVNERARAAELMVEAEAQVPETPFIDVG